MRNVWGSLNGTLQQWKCDNFSLITKYLAGYCPVKFKNYFERVYFQATRKRKRVEKRFIQQKTPSLIQTWIYAEKRERQKKADDSLLCTVFYNLLWHLKGWEFRKKKEKKKNKLSRSAEKMHARRKPLHLKENKCWHTFISFYVKSVQLNTYETSTVLFLYI